MALIPFWIVRTLLDFFNSIPESQHVQAETLKDNIQWAKNEKRILVLRHGSSDCTFHFPPIFSKLIISRQLETQQNVAALTLIDSLLTELKRLDNKMILTEVHLESRVYHRIGNLVKGKVHSNLVV